MQEEKEEQKQEPEQDIMSSVENLVENELKELLDIGIQQDNIDNIGKLVDIHKDIEHEKHWEKEEYKMNYGYDRYGADDGHMSGYAGDRYEAERPYGRRGVPGTGRRRYRGPEGKIHEMMEHFGNYSAASNAANMGNYGAEEDSMRSLDNMLNCVCMFMDMLEEEAGSQEEAQMIKKYRKKIGE